MTNPSDAAAADARSRSLRWMVYALLAALAAGNVLGRTLAVQSVDRIGLEQHLARQGKLRAPLVRPFLSANDRSRWCTIRALVDEGTYAIDNVIQQPGWDTIDMVKHDGKLYSSKPPLLPTILAGEYWLIQRLTGARLGEHPFAIGRLMLLSLNLPSLLIVMWTTARLAERFGQTDFGRVVVVAAAALGTFLTTFAVTLNNHLPAAACAALSLEYLIRIGHDRSNHGWDFAAAGLTAALAAANELPALAWFAAVLGVAVWRDARRTLLWLAPAAALVATAFFAANYAAHGSLIPAYAHRQSGENWYDYTYTVNGQTRESYWRHRQGIDRGEEDPARYARHVLVGHHGVFSLTPLWLLTVLGWGLAAASSRTPLRGTLLLIAAVSLVCLAFYLARPLIDRNYGGMTSGFRWVFWLAPLWLVSLLPAADALARHGRWAMGLALALLVVSVLSASYPTWNPWTHPWLVDLGNSVGWWELR